MSQSKQGMCQDLLKTFEEEEKDKMIQGRQEDVIKWTVNIGASPEQ